LWSVTQPAKFGSVSNTGRSQPVSQRVNRERPTIAGSSDLDGSTSPHQCQTLVLSDFTAYSSGVPKRSQPGGNKSTSKRLNHTLMLGRSKKEEVYMAITDYVSSIDRQTVIQTNAMKDCLRKKSLCRKLSEVEIAKRTAGRIGMSLSEALGRRDEAHILQPLVCMVGTRDYAVTPSLFSLYLFLLPLVH
jgi:hypothetical protein